ncbi:MAG: NADH-quinone oxidoreductase subunit A [Polyangia bacterium]
MGSDYTAAALAILAGVGMAVAFSGLARFVGERRVTRAKQITYEAGSDPVGSPRVRIPVRFYPVAILFLVFDIEVAFLYPWAVNYSSLSCLEPLVKGTCQAGASWLGLGAVLVFMAVLLLALAYVWRKRAIGWD